MKNFKNTITLAIATLGVLLSTVGAVHAASAPLCTLDPLPLNKYAKSFTQSGQNVTATFTLKGETSCKFDMTLFTFQAPAANGQPVKDQTLYSYATGTFGPGTHTLTTTAPDCYYQFDIVTGKPIEAIKGTRYNDIVNTGNMTNQGRIGNQNNINAHVHDALIGGTKACVTPEKPVITPKPTPTQPTPVVITKEVTKEVEKSAPVTTVPVTGAGDILAGTAGLSTTVGAAYHYIRSRKKLIR